MECEVYYLLSFLFENLYSQVGWITSILRAKDTSNPISVPRVEHLLGLPVLFVASPGQMFADNC